MVARKQFDWYASVKTSWYQILFKGVIHARVIVGLTEMDAQKIKGKQKIVMVIIYVKLYLFFILGSAMKSGVEE
jgi:hypothetical protein